MEKDESVLKKSGTEIRFEISPQTLRKLPAMHEFIYILEYDLADYCSREEKTPTALVKELQSVGMIADARIFSLSGDLTAELKKGELWYIVLYSTILGNDFIDAAVGLPRECIFSIDRETLGDTDIISYNIRSKQISFASASLLSNPYETGEQPAPGTVSEKNSGPAPPEKAQGQKETDRLSHSTAKSRSLLQDIRESELCRSDPFADEKDSGRNPGGTGVRVDPEKLDNLINLVGELVTAESMVSKNPDLEGLSLERFERSAHNLRRIISELQKVAMSVRMISLAEMFSNLVRTVRDLSAKHEKKIRVKLQGQDTRTDKTVIEQINESLQNIIRYHVLFGIEDPEERSAAGKPETAVIGIEARQEGGEILITVSDNGRGLDRKNILHRAVRRGLIQNDAPEPSYEDLCRFIFNPAFYSSEDPDRHARLPRVREHLEKIKGNADVQSSPGKGTMLILRIPVSRTIIDGMLIRIGRTICAVPLLSVRESFRIESSQITVIMSGQEIIRIRNELLPVVRLHRIYGITAERTELEEGILISVFSGQKKICLFADEIIGHCQTVVKEMPEYIGMTAGISGCTILEDGGIGFILDVGRLIDMTESEDVFPSDSG